MDFAKRRKRLLERHGAVLLYMQAAFEPNFHYLTGKCLDNSAYLLTRERELIITSSLNRDYAENLGFETLVPPKNLKGGMAACVQKLLAKEKITSISAELEKLGPMRLRILGKAAKISEVSESLLMQRMVKENEEIECTRKAVAATFKALESLDNAGRAKGRSELDVYYDLLESYARQHAGAAFEPIVAFDGNSRFPHSQPTRRKELESLMLVDSGARWNNYCSDVTECYPVPNAKIEKMAYEKIKGIFDGLIDASSEFKTTNDVTAFVAAACKKQKLPPMIHSIGHGVGLEIHEYPFFRKGKSVRLRENMVLAIEPGAYGLKGTHGKFGVRYERTLLVTKKGFKLL